ncbi:MAG: hypothetical protein ACREBF_02350 [Candidatus Micrarchaeales archaeon]
MPRIIEPQKRQELKIKMLKILGINARTSNSNLAKLLEIPKSTAQMLFAELVKEYDLHFTAEIGIEELWRWEFVKQARTYNKKGILEKVIDNLPELGFEEFIIFLKFLDGSPSAEELSRAAGRSYIPQFVGMLHGEYDVVMYAVARNYDGANRFVIELGKQLHKYKVTSDLLNITRMYGFFPLGKKLIEQFHIPDTYEHILMGLHNEGRMEFSGIAKKFKHGLPHILYAYDRLKKTNILTRLTYYEGKPHNIFSVLIRIKIVNETDYFESRGMWFLDMVKNSENKHTNYTFMCDISNPQGILLLMNFADGDAAESFVAKLRKLLRGAEISYFVLTKIVFGNLGVRDFDMKFTVQYKDVVRAKLL